jgi:phenylalanyl-tRNA synthetase alpha chain
MAKTDPKLIKNQAKFEGTIASSARAKRRARNEQSSANLASLRGNSAKEIEKAESLKELDEIFKKYLGKAGMVSQVLRSLKKLPKLKRVKIGKEANELKNFLKNQIEQRAREIKEKIEKETKEKEWFDITAPGKKPALGHLHPLTLTRRKVEEIFQAIGFSVVEGPEIETEWYNFDAVNIPKEHPARDLWDTLWLKPQNQKSKTEPGEAGRGGRGGEASATIKNQKLLLRTHTSPVQVRYMEKNNPPLRIIVPGRVFRHEATDASHEINFYQVEGLMVDQKGKVSVANFRAMIEEFAKRFFGKNVKIRLRPSFFPFTEPSFEVDISCPICQEKGCSVCKRTGWVETMGAGMVHPNVFKNSGLNPKDWQGFAFGMGLDRLAMMKYKINDIRLFYSGDLRFLNQF